VAHHLSPETCEDELKTITRKLYTYRVYRDIFLAICATISLIVLFYSFQVSEDIIEECKSACDATGVVMQEVTPTRCVCMQESPSRDSE